jgi:hypothetical protein
MKQQWYIDPSKKLFVTSEKNPAPVTVNRIPFGSVIDLELFFVSASSPIYDFLDWSANLGYDVIISAGIINGRATGGTATLGGSSAVNCAATAGEVQTALNAVLTPHVVTVRQADGGYYVKHNAMGVRAMLTGDGANLTPASEVVVRPVTTGAVDAYEEVFISYERKPLVVATTFTSIDNGRRGTLAFNNTPLYTYLGTNSSVTLALTVTVETPDGYVDVPINQNITITAGISTNPGTSGPSYPSALTLETANKNFIQNRSDITGFSGTGDEYLDGIATVALQLNTKLSFATVDGTEYLATLKFGTNTESLVAPIIVLPDDYNASTNAKYWKVNTTKGDTGATGAAGADGIDGDDGANGANGTNGDDGKTLTASAIDPVGGDGVDGDVHINTDTKDVFKKTAGTWVLLDNISGGPAGAAALFTSGSTAPADIDGEDGYAYLRTTNNDFYIKVSGSWGSPIGNLTGGTGPTGTRGSKWYSGSGAPGTISGSADGDLYLRTSNNALYEKASGSWGSPIANISGASGNQIRVGTGVPSDLIGSDGDIYINDANGAMYKKASSTWGSPFFTMSMSGGTWGSITGTLSAQTDLQSALNAKAATSHTHVMADVTDAGNAATKNVGTTAGTVAAGDDSRFSTTAGDISTHIADTANPHAVTKTHVGLSNVTNDAQLKLADAGNAATKNVGTTAGTVAAGDDGRFTDTRTPTDNTVSTAKVVANAITNAKLAQMANYTIKGRYTASTGDAEDLTPAQARAVLSLDIEWLSANRTVYVATTGNDTTGDGTVGTPWLTIQYALNKLSKIHLNGYTYTVSIANGTYTTQAITLVDPVGYGAGGRTVIKGGSGTASDVILTGDNVSTAIYSYFVNNYTIQDVTIRQTGTTADCIQIVSSFGIWYSNIRFGQGNVQLRVTQNSVAQQTGNCESYENAQRWVYVDARSYLVLAYLTAFGTRTYSSPVVGANDGSRIWAGSMTKSGTVTGARYIATGLAMIDTNGGGASFLPGGSAGSVGTTPPGYYF